MPLYLDFNGWLTLAGGLTGGLWAINAFFIKQKPEPQWAYYGRYFFPIILAVLALRVCLFEPFRIPSGSMKPTVFEGEFILVKKYAYGIRLPLVGLKVIPWGGPKRGDILVFRYPPDTRYNFIKRLVGLPGDRISYKNKVLYVNGEPQSQTLNGRALDKDIVTGQVWRVNEADENLEELSHPIWVRSGQGFDLSEIVVPEGQYFMMGDNRDNSGDSRVWGFVPEALIIGKAVLVWMSWDSEKQSIRIGRIGTVIS